MSALSRGFVVALSLILGFLLLMSLSFGLDPNTSKGSCSFLDESKIDGLTVVAPPRKFPDDPMLEISEIGAGWITTVPYGFFTMGQPSIRYNTGRQWWGERVEGIQQTIKLAHQKNIKVMLKPQLWSHTGWIGDQEMKSDRDWEKWEEQYSDYILFYAKLATENEVDMLCIGTELKKHVQARPEFYIALIAKIRSIYSGKLLYSSNWDSYKNVTFWDKLDYIGLSAYFPLSDDKTPKVSLLKKAWKPISDDLSSYSCDIGKKIVFTEYGYLSVDGAAGKTWLLEKKVKSLEINEQAQANALEALYSTFGEEDFWAGGFLWKWFPFGQGGEGYNERDYTPQGKLASDVVHKYYSKW